MASKKLTESENAVSDKVRSQYSQAPFPPVSFFPILNGPPKQPIWLYSFTEAYYHAFRVLKSPAGARLLDAGCGTGHGISQIRHLAPGAEVHACDFSAQSLEHARKRIEALGEGPVSFHEMNLLDLSKLPGKFDAIFCSGVVHHTANPVKALKELKSKLKPDGVLFLMLYSKFGRQPTMLMQQAIKLLSCNSSDQQEGLRLGRMLFDVLPPTNPIATWEREKWNNNHRKHTEAFIDMYVNANEKNYTVREVYNDLEAAGLKFVRFSNPQTWNLSERIAIPPELAQKFSALPKLEQYELMEHLFPDQDQYLLVASHEESTVSLPEWLTKKSLSGQEDQLTALRSPFATELNPAKPKPGVSLWSGYYGRKVRLDQPMVKLLNNCDGRKSISQIVEAWEHEQGPEAKGKGIEFIRMMENHGLIYISGTTD